MPSHSKNYSSITTLDEILALYDEDFVNTAYQLILRREADLDGLRYYLGRIRRGVSKIDILSSLRLSNEGKKLPEHISGLDKGIQKYRKSKIPLIGIIFEDYTDNTRMRLQVMENKLHMIDKKLEQRFDFFATSISQIHRSLSKIKDNNSISAVEVSECLDSSNEVFNYGDSNDYQVVIQSSMFDANFYLSHYPDVKIAGLDPVMHYMEIGWKEDRNPNLSFNTRYYKTKYPDIIAAGMNPFVHWLQYGKNEGRFINSIEVDPYHAEPNNCPSVIFISHEASQTGAPAVLLSLMQWVKQNTDINFSIVVGTGGPWNSKFEALAPTFFMDAHHHEFDKELRNFCGNHVQTVYINTIASALYAEHLKFLHAEFITHVHEMEYAFSVFQPHVEVLKQICTKYIAVSQGSIDAIEKRFDMDAIELKFLKPFIDSKRQLLVPVFKPTTKKVIFGCGAVEMRKGFDIFCIVASLLKAKGIDDFYMYWIGSDSDKDLVASEVIAQHNVADVVEFMGVKEYPREFFEWGDIFLLPSREDPYPLVCMEAAECDMPVICFDEKAGGMHSFVEDDAGVVVPYLNIEAMVDAVEMLLNDEQKREIFGKIAHQKVKDRHYVDVIAPQIIDFLPKDIKLSATIELESYKRRIEDADAVSFDIFDTLVTRKLSDPNIVFDVLEYKHTQNEAAPLPLFNERMQTAGKVLGSYNGKKDDISIDEIYKNMSFYKDSEIEKKTEIQMCVVHPMGKMLYDYAKKLNKHIIITSDMYLDKETVQAILQKNGITDWNTFYLSSEQAKKKDTGKLFELLKQDAKKADIQPDKILHIGDNWIGDIKWAKQAGIKAVRFSPLYEKSYKLVELETTQEQQLSQIGKIWSSFTTQATRLWKETYPAQSQDFYTRLGFELTGPLAAMMAMHTRALADEIGAQKIVFMARDGRIIKKAFDKLYKQEIAENRYTSDYLHLSRATVIPATFEHPLSSNDIYFLMEGLHLLQKPVSYFVKKANLDIEAKNVIKIVKSYFSSLDTIPKWEDLNKLSQMFTELSYEIHLANAENRVALKTYLEHHDILDQEKIIIVDVGWMLNIQSRLDRFIKTIGSETKVVGSYVGSRDRINKSISHSSLLFDSGDPFMYANFIEENVTLFEVLFSSPEPSASSLELRDEKVQVKYKELDKPLPSNEFIVAQKLHMGAETYFERLVEAREEFFPEQVSKDYFFKIFEALVNSDSDLAKATLGHFEVRLGGHHEFVVYQQLVKNNTNFEYNLKAHDEYFKPIRFTVSENTEHVTIVTSAGLDNGSTRYRAIHLADALRYKGISSTLIHAATPIEQAQDIIVNSKSIIFQRCFEEQGNVGKYLKIARNHSIKCIAETDDLVFPDYVHEIGSVKGGQWPIEHAMAIATSYEKLIKKVDACMVSTPLLKEYIEKSYHIPAAIIRNKVTSKRLHPPKPVDENNIKLIYASGTFSHKEDFEIIETVLFEFLSQNPQIKLSILGAAQVSERILALSNVSNYPLLEYTAMLEFIAQHDLMLVPLVDDIFNRAKSSVKFVECGAVGVPVLASKVGEFDFAIEHNKNGLLASKSQEWKELLEWIVKSPTSLNELAEEAYKTVKTTYTTISLEEKAIIILK